MPLNIDNYTIFEGSLILYDNSFFNNSDSIVYWYLNIKLLK